MDLSAVTFIDVEGKALLGQMYQERAEDSLGVPKQMHRRRTRTGNGEEGGAMIKAAAVPAEREVGFRAVIATIIAWLIVLER